MVLTGPHNYSIQSKGLAFRALELKRILSKKYGNYEISCLVEWLRIAVFKTPLQCSSIIYSKYNTRNWIHWRKNENDRNSLCPNKTTFNDVIACAHLKLGFSISCFWMFAQILQRVTTHLTHFFKGDPLVYLDFFENAMAHPRMKIQVLVSPKRPLVKNKKFEKSVGKHDLSMSFFFSKIFVIFFGINIDQKWP